LGWFQLLPDDLPEPLPVPANSYLSSFRVGTTITIDHRERGFLSMSENVAAEASSVDPLKTVADALETAVQAAKDGAADAKATVEKALPAASRFLSRFVYTTSYTFSYGIVFPAMLIAKSIPTDNAMVHGFIDGARAATETVEQLKSRQLASSVADPTPSLPS
jgi:hypothetical protein